MSATALPPPRTKVSVGDYERMIAAGTLGPEDRVELLDGEVVRKMAIGKRHVRCVNWSNSYFARGLGERGIVSVQNPLRARGSMPEPDLALLKHRADFYAERVPEAADCLLVVEVAETSAADDLGRKATLYAAAGIAEYWVVDLTLGAVHVHRGPNAAGGWESLVPVRAGTLAPLAFPDLALNVAELLA